MPPGKVRIAELSRRIALTAPVEALQAFPVGAVFIAVVSTDPATLLGYGTWSAFGAGRVLVGRDAGDTDFDTAEETGGAKTKAISAHSGTAVTGHAGAQPSAHTDLNVVQPYIVVEMWKRVS